MTWKSVLRQKFDKRFVKANYESKHLEAGQQFFINSNANRPPYYNGCHICVNKIVFGYDGSNSRDPRRTIVFEIFFEKLFLTIFFLLSEFTPEAR